MQSLISITFDDGFRCQFESALPILNSYGLQATFFLIANQDPTHDRWLGHTEDWWKIDWREEDVSMLKRVIVKGHEIGSHSVSHDPRKMPTQPDIEARDSKRLIESWLGITVSSFCYPFYRSHAYLAPAVRASGYQQARGGGIPPQYGPQASFYAIQGTATLDWLNVDCRQILNSDRVADWVRPGYWHVLTYHGIGSDRDGWEPISLSQFMSQMQELAKWRDAGTLQVLTFKDAAARLRQLK